MEKYFVSYEQALALKELGFDEPCLAFYWNTGKFYTCAEYRHRIESHKQNQLGDYNYDSTSAPLKQQVFEWFRKEHHLFGKVYHVTVGGFAKGEVPKDWQPEFRWEIYKPVGMRYYQKDKITVKIGDNLFKSWYNYEEAESVCIDNLIEIVKYK